MSLRVLLYRRKFIAPGYIETLQFYLRSISAFIIINIELLLNKKDFEFVSDFIVNYLFVATLEVTTA
jgi:hypothetical protein